MYIKWENINIHKIQNTLIFDIGDFRFKLAEQKKAWVLSMAVRVYSTDKNQTMLRPFVVITTFCKPCSEESAKDYTDSYISNLLLGALQYTDFLSLPPGE